MSARVVVIVYIQIFQITFELVASDRFMTSHSHVDVICAFIRCVASRFSLEAKLLPFAHLQDLSVTNAVSKVP